MGPEDQELFWQERNMDMVRILDDLESVEAAMLGLKRPP